MTSEKPEPLYYLHNYRTLLAWVRSRYGDLLSEAEIAYADQFLELPEPAQALLTRLITRKGELFRLSKLAYQEIPDLPRAIAPLQQLGWLTRSRMVSASDIFGLLSRAELTSWLGKYAGTKAAWLAEFAQVEAEDRPWDDWFSGASLPCNQQLVGDLVAVTIMPFSDVYCLLFFGNHYQALSEFVLAELGIFQYEQVGFSHACRSFTSRVDLDAYRQLQGAREDVERDDDVAAALLNMPAAVGVSAWLIRRMQKFSFHLGVKLEQRGDYEAALAVYSTCEFIEARARRVRVLEKLSRRQEALALLNDAIAAPHSEAERQQLLRARPRLQRALNIIPEKPVAFSPASSVLTLDLADNRVEQAVAAHFHLAAEPVCWTENSLWTGLFGLFFWPAIYAPIPGAFFNPFQARPKDLYHQSFASSRADMLRDCWRLLDTSDYPRVLLQRYREKQGLQSPLVNWNQLSEDQLALALACIAPEFLTAIFKRMLFDLKANSSGFPDLIQFYPAQQRFRLIEVKGPGDKLQDNQLRWLEFFDLQGIAAEVCYVRWTPT
ncbi:nuclease Fan1 [Simiduia litorea]|uniref:VRR-NUC domain-containing protein n=1 Tax=Simiduia litorea TaxID=1435348 RepID=UPI0036F443E5